MHPNVCLCIQIPKRAGRFLGALHCQDTARGRCAVSGKTSTLYSPIPTTPNQVVSAGGRGTEGESLVQLLPMSDYTVFCRASGKPQPAVRWIRGGDIPIDPSTVKEDETGTKWLGNWWKQIGMVLPQVPLVGQHF